MKSDSNGSRMVCNANGCRLRGGRVSGGGWVGSGAGGVAQIMQQLHCNSPRAGGLAAASEPTACSERAKRASAFGVARAAGL